MRFLILFLVVLFGCVQPSEVSSSLNDTGITETGDSDIQDTSADTIETETADTDSATGGTGDTGLKEPVELLYEGFDDEVLDLSVWYIAEWMQGLTQFGEDNIKLVGGELVLDHTYDAATGGKGADVGTIDSFGYGTYTFYMKAPENTGTICTAYSFSDYSLYTDEIDIELYDGVVVFVVWNDWIYSHGFEVSSTHDYLTFITDTSGYHEYKYVWTPDSVSFYMDGVWVHTFEDVVPDLGLNLHLAHWAAAWDPEAPQKEPTLSCTVDWVLAESN